MKNVEKIVIGVLVALFSVLATLAFQGAGSVSRAEVDTLVEKREAAHEFKVDIVMDRLNKIEINQARAEEKIDNLNEELKRLRP